MLTPRFELSQTDNEVTVIIHAPYANIKDTVVHVDGNDFRFYSTPYYLRYTLINHTFSMKYLLAIILKQVNFS